MSDASTAEGVSLRDDGERIGHAILQLAVPLAAAPALCLRFPDGSTLGADGRRGRGRHLFATQALGPLPCRAVRLGPEVTAHVREAELVTFVDAAGAALGTVAWEGIRPPPALGAGVRLAGGSGVRRRNERPTPPVMGRPRLASGEPDGVERCVDDPAAPAAPPALAVDPTAAPQSAARRRRGVMLPLAVAAGMLGAAAVGSVLAGFVGWTLEPTALTFAGPAGGPFQPTRGEVRLRLAPYARPLLRAALVPADSVPDWLVLRQTRDDEGWLIAISPSGTARDLAAGGVATALPLAFPLHRIAEAVRVTLRVAPPPTPAAADKPVAAKHLADKSQADKVQADAPAPPRVEAQLPIDDALCDRLAGNRFDGDHPAATPHTEEIFTLAAADLDAGLAACDPSPTRTGAARRFGVQRGRLLAHRALLRLAGGDVAGAAADMDAAVLLWRHGDELGSAYAANLLGAFYGGTFNRPTHDFVVPDDRAADGYWRRAMEGGNIVGQRNYAAQLLAGKGVAADPPRALSLLGNAADKGEMHAAGILGRALYMGEPGGVPADPAKGWPLLVKAQCVDKQAAVLVAAEVAAGRRAVADQRTCR